MRSGDGRVLAQCYSGYQNGKNNPELQDKVGIGPIPQGWYTLTGPEAAGPGETSPHGPYVICLVPDQGNEMYDRAGFLIHGDSIHFPGTASFGCIIPLKGKVDGDVALAGRSAQRSLVGTREDGRAEITSCGWIKRGHMVKLERFIILILGILLSSSTAPKPLSASSITQVPPYTLFTQTQTITVANTVAETSLVGTGVGSVTLPANFFTVGRSINIRLWGIHSSVANPNVTLSVKLNGTPIMTTGAHASGNGANDTFEMQGIITCRSTGAMGTVFSQGFYDEYNQNGAKVGLANTTTNTVNTTAVLVVDVTFTWGTMSLSNTISATNLILSQVIQP